MHKSKIIDCITFFDNNFMFELRYNILNGNKQIEYPGMNFDETLLNMKIIDEWVNA